MRTLMLRLRDILPAEAAIYSSAQPELPQKAPPLLVFDPVEPDTGD